ncbi:MAG TPA: OB-fold domain-containing protein [Candidatus Methanoperedens sp.]|nr:OB-fold domain-containing protein [Candidatus Methanoperedens sp.]
MISPIKVWRNQKKYAQQIGKVGTIISWTIINISPEGFIDQSPYPIALIKLSDGTNTLAQIVDWEEKHLRKNQPVIATIRRTQEVAPDEVIAYGIKFKPLD